MRAKVVIEFLVVGSMEMYGVVGLTICRHGSSKCCIWLDAELREEFNGNGKVCGSYYREVCSQLNVNRL